MALFDNNTEKESNISKKIEKDIKKKKNAKIKGRGMTKKSYINTEKKEKEKVDNSKLNEDKYMDLDQK